MENIIHSLSRMKENLSREEKFKIEETLFCVTNSSFVFARME